MTDIIHVSQPGKVVGRKVHVGEFKTVPVDPEAPAGPQRLAFVLTKKRIPLGDGVDVESSGPNVVNLAITAAAAKRLGIPHPANKDELSQQEVARLSKIIGNGGYGQQEQRKAITDLEAAGYNVQVDPALRAWIFSG